MKPAIPFYGSGQSVLDNLDLLVPPAFWHCPEYVETIGPEAGDLMRLFGFGPNPEQQLLLDAGFGMDGNGRLSAFEMVVIAARQNLKTGLMIQRAVAKALLLRRPMQIWTAHKESATDQAFTEFENMAKRSAEFSKRIKSMPAGKGSKAVNFVNGCTIVFRPRTGKAGQSMSGDDVDLDEYFAAEPKHEGSLIPTLSTRPNAQVGKFSSAPHLGSHLQRSAMSRGRAASLGLAYEPTLLYAEWSPIRHAGQLPDGRPRYAAISCTQPKCSHRVGVEGCIADNREVIKLANPSAGRSAAPSITFDFIASERRSLANPDSPPDAVKEWLKERLSIGEEGAAASLINLFGASELWTRGSTREVPEELQALGIAVSFDRDWISLTGGNVFEDDNGDLAAHIGPILRTQDFDEAIAEAKRIQDETDCVVVIDEKGPAASLEDDFDRVDLAVELATLDEFSVGCARFADRVRYSRLLHLKNKDLDTQVAAAEWRKVGDRRVLDRTTEVTLLEAGILATVAAEKFGAFNIR